MSDDSVYAEATQMVQEVVSKLFEIAERKGLTAGDAACALASALSFHAFQLLLAMAAGDVRVAAEAHRQGFHAMILGIAEPVGRVN